MALITAFVALALAHTGFAKSTPHAKHATHSTGSSHGSATHHSRENKASALPDDASPFAQDPYQAGPSPQDLFPPMEEDPEQVIIQEVKECINVKLGDIVKHCPESVKDKAWCGKGCQNSVNQTLTKLSDGVCCEIAKGTPFEPMIPQCKKKVMPGLIDKLHESYMGGCSATELIGYAGDKLPWSPVIVACVGFVSGAVLTATLMLMRRKTALANEQPLLA